MSAEDQRKHRWAKYNRGECQSCDALTEVNALTGRRFWNCQKCRLESTAATRQLPEGREALLREMLDLTTRMRAVAVKLKRTI